MEVRRVRGVQRVRRRVHLSHLRQLDMGRRLAGAAGQEPRLRPRARGLRGILGGAHDRSEEHTSELQSRLHLVCRLLLEKKKKKQRYHQSFIEPYVTTQYESHST